MHRHVAKCMSSLSQGECITSLYLDYSWHVSTYYTVAEFACKTTHTIVLVTISVHSEGDGGNSATPFNCLSVVLHPDSPPLSLRSAVVRRIPATRRGRSPWSSST